MPALLFCSHQAHCQDAAAVEHLARSENQDGRTFHNQSDAKGRVVKRKSDPIVMFLVIALATILLQLESILLARLLQS